MEGIPIFIKYDLYIEEAIDPQINPNTTREVDAIILDKIGRRKVIFIKAEDYQNTFY
jgi:hypothetical protein